MRPLWFLLVLSVQPLAILPFASNFSLSAALPSNANISSERKITSNGTQSLNEMQILCKVADPLFPLGIEVEYCGPAISIACRIIRTMAESHEGRGSWNWVTLAPRRNCVAAYYVPFEARPWMFPLTLDECYIIFERILYVCGRRHYTNVGTVNVDALPNDSWPGTAPEEEFPRYLMASKRL